MQRLPYEPAMTLRCIILALLLPLAAVSQQSTAVSPQEAAICMDPPHTHPAAKYRAIRVVEDRGTGQRWLLLEDLEHPSAPARFYSWSREFSCAHLFAEGSQLHSAENTRNVSLPVIHAGDALLLSEHTRIADAELEGTALTTAAPGETLTVSLKFGRRTLKAIATAPGRAAVSESGSEVPR